MSMLATRELTKSFSGLVAVDHVTTEIEAGSITGLIGPNGSGKTTLFNLITGILEPTQGRVLFQGNDITEWSTEKCSRSGLVRTFQQTQPFGNLTVHENMLVPPTRLSPAKRDEKANELLSSVDIHHLRNEPANSLSYGQQRLLEIARILMTDPEMVLLDEPASGINPALMEDIRNQIYRFNESGVTFLIIEHNMKFIGDICDEIIVLANGSQITRGNIDAVMDNDQVRDAYLGG
jgi:branched-chain amino acid transport system ATP-binding protein